MLGKNPGYVTVQGEILYSLFKRDGYPVISTSSIINRYLRLIDIIKTIIGLNKEFDILIIHVYGGRSFVVEDIASWLGIRFNKKMVMFLHGGAMPEFMTRFPYWSNRVLQRANLIIAPSKYLAREVQKRGFPAQIIPNVVRNISELPYKPRRDIKPNLLWMRSFDSIYRPEMAVKSLIQIEIGE